MCLHFLEDAAAISSITIHDNKGNDLLLNSIRIILFCWMNAKQTCQDCPSWIRTKFKRSIKKKRKKDCPIRPQSLQWLRSPLFTRHGLMSQTCFRHRRNSAAQRLKLIPLKIHSWTFPGWLRTMAHNKNYSSGCQACLHLTLNAKCRRLMRDYYITITLCASQW